MEAFPKEFLAYRLSLDARAEKAYSTYCECHISIFCKIEEGVTGTIVDKAIADVKTAMEVVIQEFVDNEISQWTPMDLNKALVKKFSPVILRNSKFTFGRTKVLPSRPGGSRGVNFHFSSDDSDYDEAVSILC